MQHTHTHTHTRDRFQDGTTGNKCAQVCPSVDVQKCIKLHNPLRIQTHRLPICNEFSVIVNWGLFVLVDEERPVFCKRG